MPNFSEHAQSSAGGGAILLGFGLRAIFGSRYQRRKRQEWLSRAPDPKVLALKQRAAYVYWVNTEQSSKIGGWIGCVLAVVGVRLLGPIYVAGTGSPERRSHPWKNE